MISRINPESGIFLEPVLLDYIPVLMETYEEEGEIFDEETGETYPVTHSLERPLLDKEGNTIPDPQYVDVPVPDGFYWPKWDGEKWIEGGKAPEPTETPHMPTLEEQVVQLQEENQTLRETVDGIFTEVLPSIFGM